MRKVIIPGEQIEILVSPYYRRSCRTQAVERAVKIVTEASSAFEFKIGTNGPWLPFSREKNARLVNKKKMFYINYLIVTYDINSKK